MRRDEWAGSGLPAWLHPGDTRELARLEREMGSGAASAVVRLGPWGKWARCRLELTQWVDHTAGIVVRAMPPAESSAIVVTLGDRIVHVSREAEELYGATAWEMEGSAWAGWVHPLDLKRRASPSLLASGAFDGTPVVIRSGQAWRLVRAWPQVEPDGSVTSRMGSVEPSAVLGRPLPSMIETGLVSRLSGYVEPEIRSRTTLA